MEVENTVPMNFEVPPVAPDPVLTRGLAARYGKADREISRLIDCMLEVPESAGKKTVFGADRQEAAIKVFIKQLYKTCAVLIALGQLKPSSTKAASLSALNSILASYRIANPHRAAAFRVWDDFFRHQVTVEPHKPWLMD
jgi:hypothetical protein